MKAVEVSGLCCGYNPGTNVLEDVSFSLERGSITAVLGRNGCGKSTLLDCLIGYNHPCSGTVSVDGMDMVSVTPREIARRVAYIPQNTNSALSYRVRDFILFGRTCHLELGGNLSDEDYRTAEDAAVQCGITHLMDKEIDKLSGGERQLVFVARALTQQSSVILMDEPMSSLDFGNQALIFRMIRDLSAKGKTVLFTTHNPNHVIDMDCDIMIIDDHRIWETGRASDLLTLETIRRIYGDGIAVMDGSKVHYSFSSE